MMNNIQKLSNSITYLSQEWGLSNLRSLAESRLINNYVSLAYSSIYNADVVLKILLYNNPNEEKLLRYFNGQGCVKILNYDAEHQAFLLEYIQPGETLRSFFPNKDEESVAIVATLIKKLHNRPVSDRDIDAFPTVAQWLTALDQSYQQVPLNLLIKARTLAKKLLDTQKTRYLLHADLHHENILHDGDSWVAIDPKGVIGELEYEIGAFIRNPIPDLVAHPQVKQITKRRIELFSQLLNVDAQRVQDWCFVQSVLSACWVETYGKDMLVKYFVSCANVLEDL